MQSTPKLREKVQSTFTSLVATAEVRHASLNDCLRVVAIWLKERHSRFSRVQPKSRLFAHLLPVEEYDDADKADTRFFLVIALIPLHGRPASLPVVVAGL